VKKLEKMKNIKAKFQLENCCGEGRGIRRIRR